MADGKRELLRHTLATLAYRGGKAIRGAPGEFADFTLGESPRTAGRILAHVGDLMDWGLSMAEGKQAWKDSDPLSWEQESERFHRSLQALDDYLASGKPLASQRRDVVPRSDCGCADACGSDRDDAANRRSADQGRELRPGRDRGRPGWGAAGVAEERVLIAGFVRSHFTFS